MKARHYIIIVISLATLSAAHSAYGSYLAHQLSTKEIEASARRSDNELERMKIVAAAIKRQPVVIFSENK